MHFDAPRVIAETKTNGIIFSQDEYKADRWMPAHQHPDSHIVLCLGGVIEHHSGKESFVLNEQTVSYVPAYETHSNRFRGNVCTFQITLDEECIGFDPGTVKSTSLPKHHSTSSIMNSIFREFKSPDKYTHIMLHSLTTELLVNLHRESHELGPSNCRIPWLLNVRDLLHEELSETLQLDYIAAKAGVHPAHLTKAFRQQFGKSIGEYVRELRVSRARHLLETTDQPIGAIALATGFADQSHFTRVFKEKTGRTPSSYRPKH